MKLLLATLITATFTAMSLTAVAADAPAANARAIKCRTVTTMIRQCEKGKCREVPVRRRLCQGASPSAAAAAPAAR